MTSATQAGPEGQVPCNKGSSDELNDLESPGKAPGKEAEFNLLDLGNVGVVLHYFGKGFVAGGVGAIMTGVLAGYLNMHSDQIQSALNISSLPNVFAAPLGMLSDCRPLFGYHRRSYMTLGWLLVLASFAYMLQHGLPDPHYCFTDGFYQRHLPPCNPDAHNFYPALVTAFFVGSFGMATSDAAVAGRMIEFAKAEPLERRGRAQAAVQMVSLTGGFASVILAAFGFNGRMFTGSFDQRHQLSFRAYMLVFVIFCTATMLACAFCVREAVSATKTLKASNSSIRASCSSGWRLLESKCFCAVMLFTFAKGGICSIKTNAGIWVQLEWAGVRMLQNQLCGLIGTLLTMFGCWLTRNYFLNASWRKIIVVATLCVVVLGSISQLLTVFDVVRNQYFYLAEPILMDVPLAMTNLVSVFIANELADGNNCALVFGMLTTTVCVATRLSTLLGNQVFSFFTPALTDRDNYVADTELFRWTVAKSYFLTYLLILSSLLFLPLLPWQKQNAQDRKRDWSYRPCYAVMTVVFLVTSFSYTLVGDILAMTPSTNCMHFVGGPGCVPAS